MKTCSRLSNTLGTERKHLRLSYSVAHNRQNQRAYGEWSYMIRYFEIQEKGGSLTKYL